MSEFQEMSEERRLQLEAELLRRPIIWAWDRAITLDLPAQIEGGEVTRRVTRMVPLRYAIEAVKSQATNAKDRVFAAGILAIIEELEKPIEPEPTWKES